MKCSEAFLNAAQQLIDAGRFIDSKGWFLQPAAIFPRGCLMELLLLPFPANIKDNWN